jgi:nitroimidazol reductase NimA-like FMN-containing flavoprotein (pyridoxamine 5'-phosphate oxidase superfamily)
MTSFPQNEQNRVVRVPDRGHYDRATIYSIIDEALICHVAFVQDGRPFVIPTLHARDEDQLLLHGATTSRLIRHVAAGNEVSVAMTLVDGLVLARSVFHHSVNYRSVVLFGRGALASDDQKMTQLERFTERLIPGRWDDARQPNFKELKATAVVAIPIELASAKVRTGGPKDDIEDYALPVWAGVLPLAQHFLPPETDPAMQHATPVPAYVTDYVAQRNSDADGDGT